MPLLFSVVGYGLFYLALSPLLSPALSALSMVISNSRPDFSEDIHSIFSPQEHTEPVTSVKEEEVQMPKYGAHYARFQIEIAGIDTNLYFGDGQEILKKGIGQYMGSFIPGSGKPIMISGHNNGVFHQLQRVSAGDIITITTNYGVYEYQVTDMGVFKATDKSAYDLNQEKEQLILYTCYPFNMLGLTDKRYFVYADKVSGPPIVSE
ncbi:MAG: class D sortase [Clostridiales bacterium]|nr:class D sortase [Clostridiales bacterium]